VSERVLVAGIGNVFLGDDGFGVAVAQHLLARGAPAGADVVDAGIRGFDLACALLEDYDAAILVDTVHRDGPPGTLYLLDVDPGDDAPAEPVEAHGLAPHRVLALVRALGGGPRRLRLVGCEPATPGADDDVTAGLSAAVAAAVEPAAALVASLVAELRTSAVPRA